MNMNTDNSIQQRKADHLQICIDDNYSVEGTSAGWEQVRFLHRALPEIATTEIDLATNFLGSRLSLPLMISPMTGGSQDGYRLNRDLARAAQETGVAVGMGSMRILLNKPELFSHFALRKIAPDVPIIANIGAVQVRDIDSQSLFEMVRRLETAALSIHLNVGQELFQPDGDRDFRRLKESIARLCERCPVPVIVKETGYGFMPGDVDYLLQSGVAYVDLAGAGGTNWIQVEAYRLPSDKRSAAEEFAEWGIPTAPLLEGLMGPASNAGVTRRPIIASGGIRSGMDVAKALAMGATLTAIARPFIQAVYHHGYDGVLDYIQRIRTVLTAVMMLNGVRTIPQLQQVPLIKSPELLEHARQLMQLTVNDELSTK